MNTEDKENDISGKSPYLVICVIIVIGIIGVIIYASVSGTIGNIIGSIIGNNNTWTITQYSSVTGLQSMFYTIEDRENRLIIIDGGWDADSEQVRDVIKEHGDHVYAWIITHPHPDHVGAFNQIMLSGDDIEIDDVYCPDVNYDRYRETAHEWDVFEVCETFFEVKKDMTNIHYVSEGDEWDMLGLHVKVLHSWDEKVDQLSGNLCNKGSIMFQLYGEEENMLFCADTEEEVQQQILDAHKDELAADYLQAGHHGNWGLTKDFYQYVNPKTVFFDSTDDLLTPGEAGYDAGELKKYFEEQEVSVVNFSTAPNVIRMK